MKIRFTNLYYLELKIKVIKIYIWGIILIIIFKIYRLILWFTSSKKNLWNIERNKYKNIDWKQSNLKYQSDKPNTNIIKDSKKNVRFNEEFFNNNHSNSDEDWKLIQVKAKPKWFESDFQDDLEDVEYPCDDHIRDELNI